MVKTLDGEYWFIKRTSVFADGDIGDRNHSAVVRDHIYSQFVDELQLVHPSLARHLKEESDPVELRTDLFDLADQSDEFTEEQKEDILDHLTTVLGWSPQRHQVLFDTFQETEADIRAWACQELGWARNQKNNLETYGITASKLIDIAEALFDAYPDEELLLRQHFDLYNYEDKKFYRDIPYSLLAEGEVGDLRKYT
jgi:hypothetical protein